MARKNTTSADLGDQLEGFVGTNKPEAVAAPVRRSGSRPRKAAPKLSFKSDDIVEGTDEIDPSGFISMLSETVREKNAKQERVFNLLNNKSVRVALKEFIDKIGGVHLAYERLTLVAPDVRKSSFMKAWKECGYGSSSAAE